MEATSPVTYGDLLRYVTALVAPVEPEPVLDTYL